MKSISVVILFLSVFYVNSGFCQKLITGKIVDIETNDPIDKAVVYNEEDSLKTISNYLGYFQLEVDSTKFLIIEKEGYTTSRIQIPPQNSFLIKIKPTAQSNTVEVLNEYEKGVLLDGYKSGIWEYYDESGKVDLRVDYNTAQVIFIEPDTSKYAIQFGDDYKMIHVDRPPRYIGSKKEFYDIVNFNIKYPVPARSNTTVGKFYILFEVDSLGQAKNFRAVNDIRDGCGKEAIRALKLVPNLWIPAMIEGKTYNSRFAVPVTFKIEKDGYPAGRPRKSKKKEELPVAKILQEIEIKAVGFSR